MNIGGVELDNDLIWEDEFQFNNGTGVADHTISGTLVVQTFTVIGYQPLTLRGDANFGWQKRSTVLALQALANQNPSGIFVVTLPDTRTFNAMFRNEEAPVLEFTPVTRASAPGADFWYYGTVKMRIIQ